MMNNNNLQRFLNAQENDYPIALSEIKKSRKKNHWMWYIFPQLKGLGISTTSIFYAIKDKEEAEAYLNHPVLGNRLVEICNELLKLKSNDAYQIFDIDDKKLKSSITLFALLENTNPVFHSVLEKFFQGKKDNRTLKLLQEH